MIKAARGGFDAGDFGNCVHSAFDPAENGIAVLSVFVVERSVVREIDKELAGGGIGVCRPRHGDGAGGVFQAVAGFVGNGFIGCLLYQVFGKSAALDNETVDNAVKNGVVVKAFSGIAHEISNGFGGFGLVQNQTDIAHIGFHQNMGCRHRRQGNRQKQRG
ncbi:Uncharacterised protein [Neisseria meningitidis]|nr:Uncharacterised protein [Neisseria meningitidis]CWM41193.1 Uncharacterised protein [Neisseria meningitidis]CWM57785.1 Uncharacterised protein [Neisseria meningitidis]CWN67844.1 Uncharacterised protein [Neisseria meningitidis]CWP33188.1 Uncharacterised protein [Neisseria meningitidis]